MTFKEVSKDLPPLFEFKEIGDSITGKFKSKKSNIGKHKSSMYVLDVDGALKSIWGTTVLDSKMLDPEIKEDALIRITYLGEEKGYKDFKVEVDSSDIPEESEETPSDPTE